MKMPQRYIVLFCLSLLATGPALAQNDTTVLDDENIDIIKEFEPVVERASKKHFAPDLPTITTQKPVFNDYNLPVKYRSVTYSPSELKPLGIQKEEDVSLPLVYLKAGFGNYLTPLVDFRMSNKKADRYRVGLGVEHLSSKRRKIENQRFGETDVSAMGEYYFKGMTIGAEADFTLHDYYYYGYDQSDTSFSAAQTRNRYQGGGARIYFRNHEPNALDLDYATQFSIQSLKDGQGNREVNFRWDGGVSTLINDFVRVGGDFFTDATSLKSVMNANRFAFGLNPYVSLGRDRWQVRGGLWILIDEGTFYALPDIRHQSKLYKDYIVLYNEWIGHLGQNSLRTLSDRNPWLSPSIAYHHYRVEERNFIGFKGNIPVGIDYDARFSQLVYYDMPLVVNDTNTFRSFNLVYDNKVKAWNGHVSLGYQLADFLKIRTYFDYFNYSTQDELAAWHLPSIKAGASATYQYDNKLILKAELFGFGSVKAREADGSVKKIKGTVDLNFSANYHLNQYIAFFAQVNNALSLKHQRYYHYPGYGFMALGGVIVSY